MPLNKYEPKRKEAVKEVPLSERPGCKIFAARLIFWPVALLFLAATAYFISIKLLAFGICYGFFAFIILITEALIEGSTQTPK